MKIIKLVTGIGILAVAFMLQIWFPVASVHGDFVLAALVAFAFAFPFLELLFFVLLAAFIINWQPSVSLELLLFALIPLVAFALHRWLQWELWIGTAVSAAVGVLVFYGVVAPAAFFPNISALVADIIACMIFAELVLFFMQI